MATSVPSFKEQILRAKSDSTTIRIRGGGTKDFYGVSLDGDILDTRLHSGITEYEPTELVLTAKCGTPLREIESALDANNQMLAFEPPYFGEGATFGGCISSGFSGPRRAMQGAARDFVLGILLMNHNGSELQFGGKVMKNVAGFDVSRLICGSFGTLGLILEASVKVLPKPEFETTIVFELNKEQAIERMNDYAAMPIPLSASCFHDGLLSIRLSGSETAVKSGLKKIGGDLTDGGDFWRSIREQTHPFFQSDQKLFRHSVNPKSPVSHKNSLIEWNGSLRWIWSDTTLQEQQDEAIKCNGNAILFRNNDRNDAIQILTDGLMTLQKKVKNSLDPDGVFGKRRLFTEF